MSYSTMLQSLPTPLQLLLREPSYLAAIASVSVHGLLWAVLPHLPLSAGQPTEAEIQREVGLVELTPEELARVPQFDSQASLPIPSAPLPSNDVGRPPQEFSVTPLPASPPPQLPYVLPPSFYIPPPAARSPIIIPQTPTRPRSNPPTQRATPRPSPTPTPRATPSATPTPPSSPTPRIEQPDTSGTGTIAQAPALDRLRRPNPSNTPPASPSPSGEGNSSGQTDEQGAQPRPTTTPSSPPDDLTVARREERDRIRRLITPYPSGSVPRSSGASNVAFTDWFYEGREGRELEDLLKENISARYPSEACQLRRSETVIYGVDVNADDRIVGEPQLLFSSGYPVFDEAALNAVRRHNFNNTTSEEQPYQATVTFEYSGQVCPTGSSSDTPAG